ncbi:hypothetical protein ACEE18_04765 [Corynebacterium freneyi]
MMWHNCFDSDRQPREPFQGDAEITVGETLCPGDAQSRMEGSQVVLDVRQRLGTGGRGDDQITSVAVEAGGAQRIVGVLMGAAQLGKFERLVVDMFVAMMRVALLLSVLLFCVLLVAGSMLVVVVVRVGVRGVCHVMFQIVVGISRFTFQGVLIVVGADANQHRNRIREPMGLSTNSPNSPHCGR